MYYLWTSVPSADDTAARSKAAALLDAYAAEVRTAALREAADAVFGVSADMRECDGTYPEEWSSRDVRDAVDAAGGELLRMAEEG